MSVIKSIHFPRGLLLLLLQSGWLGVGVVVVGVVVGVPPPYPGSPRVKAGLHPEHVAGLSSEAGGGTECKILCSCTLVDFSGIHTLLEYFFF